MHTIYDHLSKCSTAAIYSQADIAFQEVQYPAKERKNEKTAMKIIENE